MNYQSIAYGLLGQGYYVVNKRLTKKYGILAAHLLSILLDKHKYYSSEGLLNDNTFFYTVNDCIEETCLSQYQQSSVFEILKKDDLITIQNRFGYKRYIGINFEKVVKIFDYSPDAKEEPIKEFEDTTQKTSQPAIKKLDTPYTENKLPEQKQNNNITHEAEPEKEKRTEKNVVVLFEEIKQLFKPDFTEQVFVIKRIKALLTTKGFDYVNNNCKYALKNHKSNLYGYLQICLSEDLHTKNKHLSKNHDTAAKNTLKDNADFDEHIKRVQAKDEERAVEKVKLDKFYNGMTDSSKQKFKEMIDSKLDNDGIKIEIIRNSMFETYRYKYLRELLVKQLE